MVLEETLTLSIYLWVYGKTLIGLINVVRGLVGKISLNDMLGNENFERKTPSNNDKTNSSRTRREFAFILEREESGLES